MEKSPAAFRTIGELSQDLGVPQHVLRYWETRFPQLRPVQRAGKRRYYRPEDVALARRIRDWLGQEGYTVKGVQRLLASGEAPSPPMPPSMPLPPTHDRLGAMTAIRALLADALARG